MQTSLMASRKDTVEAPREELKQQKMLEQLLHDRMQAERAELEKYGDQALNLEFARNEMELPLKRYSAGLRIASWPCRRRRPPKCAFRS